MTTDNQAYTSHIIEKAIISYLDENIPNTEQGLNILVYQCDDLVWQIASNIYTQSGHKVDFFVIRDLINARIELLKVNIANMKAEEAQRLAKQALIEQEQYARQLEWEAKKLEFEVQRKKQEEARKLVEIEQKKKEEETKKNCSRCFLW